MNKGTFKKVTVGFDEALASVQASLATEGFGIITQIDLQATFAAKLGVEFTRYRILGACNPRLAHAAVSHDPHIGVLLPCNVVVFERDDGTVEIGAIDPMKQLGGADSGFNALAAEVGQKLERALAAVPG